MSGEPQRTVTGVEVPAPPPVVMPSATVENPPARATTTSEQDLGTRGQRRVNLMWEAVQGAVGLLLVFTACFSVLKEKKLPAEYWLLLGIVVNSYFQRTNHTKIGGVGGTDSR